MDFYWKQQKRRKEKEFFLLKTEGRENKSKSPEKNLPANANPENKREEARKSKIRGSKYWKKARILRENSSKDTAEK